jgi:UDP-glucose 4-epimerase
VGGLVPSRRVLITGVSGFIGSAVEKRLLDEGCSVCGIDRVARGPEVPLAVPRAEFVQADLSAVIADILKRWKPEVVVHAAGPASVAGSISDPQVDFEDSVRVFQLALEAIRRHASECRVVLLSSAAVYGDTSQSPTPETTPTAPISPYGFHKQICELLLREYHQVFGIGGCSVRLFSAYGPGLRRQVLWDICRKAFDGRPVLLEGTGDETRDFLYIDDVALGIAGVVDKAACRGECYNLAGGVETSIRYLAQRLVSSLGTQNEIRFSGIARKGDPHRWWADISSIKLLGFRPEVAIDEGVGRYVDWFRRHGGRSD